MIFEGSERWWPSVFASGEAFVVVWVVGTEERNVKDWVDLKMVWELELVIIDIRIGFDDFIGSDVERREFVLDRVFCIDVFA